MPVGRVAPSPVIVSANDNPTLVNPGFEAYGAYYTNAAGQWLQIGQGDQAEFVPPSSRGTIALSGEPSVYVAWGAPGGVTQPLAIAGQQCKLRFTERPLDTTGGSLLGTQISATTQVERFTKALRPAPGSAGRLILLTDYDRGVWKDTGTQWASVERETFNVKQFNAVGDGAADDTSKIQDAIDAATVSGGVVFLPPGIYKISSSITIKANVDFIGSGMNASLIRPTGQTFPAITNNPGLLGVRIGGFKVDYVNANAGLICTNPLAAAFYFPNLLGDFIIEDVWVNLAYYGINDTGSSYMGTYRNVYIVSSNVAFRKTTNGTTLHLINVFANVATQAFQLNSQQSVTMTGCAMQTVTGLSPFSAVSCHGLVVDGFDYESNTTQAGGSLFSISGCNGFTLRGVVGNTNTLIGANTSILSANSVINDGVIIGCRFGFSETATGAGGDCSTFTTNGCRLTIIGSRIGAATSGAGAPTVRLYSIANTPGDAIMIINCDESGSTFDPGNKISHLGITNALTNALNMVAALQPATPAGASQTAGALYFVSGVPANGDGANGDWAFRTDASVAGARLYHKEAGAWVATAA